MIIRWKVVTDTRFSCMVNGSAFKLNYKKGEIVKAKEDSFGIFTFDTYENAATFCKYHELYAYAYKIIKVKPIGRGKKPKLIFSSVDLPYSYSRYLRGADIYNSTNIPKGTICYKSIQVLT